jgi:hypothetical protein
VFPVRYEPGFYIPKDDTVHSNGRETLKSYITAFVKEIKVYESHNRLRDMRWNVYNDPRCGRPSTSAHEVRTCAQCAK